MKILVCRWCAFTMKDILDAMAEEGIEVFVFQLPDDFRNMGKDDALMERFDDILHKEKFDAVFSINFIDTIAEICYYNDMMYIAWSYDSPSFGGRQEVRKLPTNRVFLFDSAEVELHKKMGEGSNLYHLNLAVDVRKFNQINNNPIDKWKYASQISFVGSLYETQMQRALEVLDPYRKEFLTAIAETQRRVYNVNTIRPLINDGIVDMISTPEFDTKVSEFTKRYLQREIEKLDEEALRYFLLYSATNRDRVILLQLLSKYAKVKLYSYDDCDFFQNITKMGTVDYRTEMPLVFRNSKLNLNTTLRSIEKGIPQRCLDIMACHGVLFTNYQEDLFLELEEDKDMIVFYSTEDAVEKAKFYLAHEDLCEKIRTNGYKKMKDCFNYSRRLNYIFKTCGLR